MKTHSRCVSTSASTATVMENYDYYDDSDYANDAPLEAETPQTAIEWFGARTRSRRELGSDSDGKETVTYKVCVRWDISTTP